MRDQNKNLVFRHCNTSFLLLRSVHFFPSRHRDVIIVVVINIILFFIIVILIAIIVFVAVVVFFLGREIAEVGPLREDRGAYGENGGRSVGVGKRRHGE